MRKLICCGATILSLLIPASQGLAGEETNPGAATQMKGTADNEGSRLTIVSPTQGAVIKGDSVEVRYKLSKGGKATHIHCYVDGEYQKGFKGVVKGLTRGSHEIKLVAASHDHDDLGAEAVVTIEVE